MPEASKQFKIRFTERIYRLHATGIGNHAPRGGGIFEIVLFPPGASDGEVLYVGHVPATGSVAETLLALRENQGGLPPEKLAVLQANLADAYFDAVSVADCQSEADWQDLAWAIVQTKKPRLNDLSGPPPSGRYTQVTFEELPQA